MYRRALSHDWVITGLIGTCCPSVAQHVYWIHAHISVSHLPLIGRSDLEHLKTYVDEMLQVRGLPSLPAVPALGLPDMPQIALPASAESLVAPIPAPRPQASCLTPFSCFLHFSYAP